MKKSTGKKLVLLAKANRVKHPGSRGGKGYYNSKGEWVYGERGSSQGARHPKWMTPSETQEAVFRDGWKPEVVLRDSYSAFGFVTSADGSRKWAAVFPSYAINGDGDRVKSGAHYVLPATHGPSWPLSGGGAVKVVSEKGELRWVAEDGDGKVE